MLIVKERTEQNRTENIGCMQINLKFSDPLTDLLVRERREISSLIVTVEDRERFVGIIKKYTNSTWIIYFKAKNIQTDSQY